MIIPYYICFLAEGACDCKLKMDMKALGPFCPVLHQKGARGFRQKKA